MSTGTHFFSLRLPLASLCLAVAVVACGGGGGSITPTLLEPESSAPWELITAGDIAQCDLSPPSVSNAEKTAKLVERQLVEAGANANVLTLGDNVYHIGTLTEFRYCYHPTWGRFLPKTFAVPGNHEYENKDANGYFDYFSAQAGPDKKGYYRIDHNGWTVFTLNSNIDASAASAQAAWLKQQLLKTKPCVLAAWHHPRFSSASRGDNTLMADMWEILDKAKADIVLNGHEHHYERFAPMTSTGASAAGAGLRSFVVGTGGADKYGFATPRANSEMRIEDYGVLRLSLQTGKADWKFITPDNAVLDTGSATCRSK